MEVGVGVGVGVGAGAGGGAERGRERERAPTDYVHYLAHIPVFADRRILRVHLPLAPVSLLVPKCRVADVKFLIRPQPPDALHISIHRDGHVRPILRVSVLDFQEKDSSGLHQQLLCNEQFKSM